MRVSTPHSYDTNYLHLDDVGGGEVENLGEYRVLVAEQAAAGDEARRKAVDFHLGLAG